ncbi:LacI family DNA-binding transcriptional regulator [Paenibacillus elgii]|nr:LacI family DNA-binding transcriptional regulator [Paenibacillus elgii]
MPEVITLPSIKDVADLAGVGVGTVFRVINNNVTVKPETREKVLSAICR